MPAAAQPEAPDRSRFPFVSPEERRQMQAQIRRDQEMDPFDNRSPLTRDVEAAGESGMGLLGVPKRDAVPTWRRVLAQAANAETADPLPASPPRMDGIATDQPVVEPGAVVQIDDGAGPMAESIVDVDSEDVRRIRVWLKNEIGRIEDLLFFRLGQQQSVVDDNADAGRMPPRPEPTETLWSAPRPSQYLDGTDAPIDLDEAALSIAAGRPSVRGAPARNGRDATDTRIPTETKPPERTPRPHRVDPDDSDPMPSFLRMPSPFPEHPKLPRRRGPRPLFADRLAREHDLRTAAGDISGWGSLILTYAVFALMPMTEWLSRTFDPRIGALVPALAFFGWLGIHLHRRDQLFQLRILTAWQVAHVMVGIYVIRPWGEVWGAVSGPPYWEAAAIAVAGGLAVVAVSAVMEMRERRRLASACD